MNATTDQTEALLLDLERRVEVQRESSELLETQLKVMLVQQSRGQISNAQVARIARTLATCLGLRGDREQAGQYATMAANLEKWNDGIRPPAGSQPGRDRMSEFAPASPARTTRTPGSGGGPSPRLPLAFVSLRGAWVSFNRRTLQRLSR